MYNALLTVELSPEDKDVKVLSSQDDEQFGREVVNDLLTSKWNQKMSDRAFKELSNG